MKKGESGEGGDFFFFFLYSHKILQNRQLQDDTTGSMEIHSNPVAITVNIFDSN